MVHYLKTGLSASLGVVHGAFITLRQGSVPALGLFMVHYLKTGLSASLGVVHGTLP